MNVVIDTLVDLFTNPVMMCAVFSWILAQIIKLFTDPKHLKGNSVSNFLVGSGGMPSSHSAAVCATCISCGLLYGFGSTYFAISGVLAVVVMRDAAGVRRESGKQAAVINRVTQEINKKKNVFDAEQLKELLGHTPLQVFAGAVLGTAMSFLCQLWLFPMIFPGAFPVGC